jgi:hypothetical protein
MTPLANGRALLPAPPSVGFGSIPDLTGKIGKPGSGCVSASRISPNMTSRCGADGLAPWGLPDGRRGAAALQQQGNAFERGAPTRLMMLRPAQ